MKRLRNPFDFSETTQNPDSIIITELGDEKFFTTNTVIKTMLGWERRSVRE
jgi:hypothetical protein